MSRPRLAGRLIVIEGPDGVGKTTVSKLIAEKLRKRGAEVLQLSFPGKDRGSVGELVYRLHHDEGPVRAIDISPLAMQALHVAAHIDAIDRQIVPALRSGTTVVLDRYWWSAWAYGLVAGCQHRKLKSLIAAERAAWGTVRPALAVLLTRPAPINREERLPLWKQLAAEYRKLAERERRYHRVAIIENSPAPDAAQASISEVLGLLTPTSESKDGLPATTRHPASSMPTPTIVSHIIPLKPSAVYDTYWRFAAERQEVLFRRLEHQRRPWTRDAIIAQYKFTNAFRASDRVSQYLIRNVIYRDDLPTAPDEVFFRIVLFKLFNKIETWETLEAALAPLTYEDYSFTRYDRVLTSAMDAGATIYSGAYIMPSGRRSLGHDRKHRSHLLLLERMLADSVPHRLTDCRRMQQAFELLKSYPGIGDFLAYQYVIDINYSELTDYSESRFVVPGPGALDGIRKCFIDRGNLNEPEIIKFMADQQAMEFERLGLAFRTLWGRPLQLIDCQNLFCEVDKYARVHHPEIQGLSGRSRIKQRLDPKPSLPPPWYPPKWGINDAIRKWQQRLPAPADVSLFQETNPE